MINPEKIKLSRQALQITGPELARRIGIRKQSLYDIERGINNPRKPTLDAIRRELDLDDNLDPISPATNTDRIKELAAHLNINSEPLANFILKELKKIDQKLDLSPKN